MSATQSQARKAGVRDALGVPAAVLAAGMLGFGALAFDAGWSVALAMACTAGVWALPGQIVLVEMHLAGAPGALTVLSVMLTAARFLPMSISLMPVIRDTERPRAAVYFVVVLVGDSRTALAVSAIVCGAIAGPLLHLVNPQWSVLLSGLIGGTVAYWIQRRLKGRHA